MFERCCPLHLRALDEQLRCAACRHERASWLVVDDKGQVVAAGREEHRNLRDPETPAVWLGPAIDDPHFLLAWIARREGEAWRRQEREAREVAWGNQ